MKNEPTAEKAASTAEKIIVSIVKDYLKTPEGIERFNKNQKNETDKVDTDISSTSDATSSTSATSTNTSTNTDKAKEKILKDILKGAGVTNKVRITGSKASFADFTTSNYLMTYIEDELEATAERNSNIRIKKYILDDGTKMTLNNDGITRSLTIH